MVRKRPPFTRFQRATRLMLSDFLHLFTPGEKKVYTWKEISIGLAIVAFLIFLASLTAL